MKLPLISLCHSQCLVFINSNSCISAGVPNSTHVHIDFFPTQWQEYLPLLLNHPVYVSYTRECISLAVVQNGVRRRPLSATLKFTVFAVYCGLTSGQVTFHIQWRGFVMFCLKVVGHLNRWSGFDPYPIHSVLDLWWAKCRCDSVYPTVPTFFVCHCHSADAPYSHRVYLPPTLCIILPQLSLCGTVVCLSLWGW